MQAPKKKATSRPGVSPKPKRLRIWGASFVVVAFFLLCGILLWRFGSFQPDPWALPMSDYEIFKHNFVDQAGRVIDTGNGDITHSESQGYGMLISEAYSDRSTFDRIWKWTQEYLKRPDDHLFSWLWKPAENGKLGGVADPNNATDGDFLIAWALLRAHERWNHADYLQSALQILADARLLTFFDLDGKVYSLPGIHGFEKEDYIILNPSYYLFPAFEAFEKAQPEAGWKQVATDGYELLERARFGNYELTTDWVRLGFDDSTEPAEEFPPDFGYNAVRVPLNILWQNRRDPLLDSYAHFWKEMEQRPEGIPAIWNVVEDQPGKDPALPGGICIAKATIGCVSDSVPTVADIPLLEPDEVYFSACLKLLTKIALRDQHRNPVD